MAGVAASPPLRRGLFHYALESKAWYLREGGHVTHPLYDALIFSKLRELMGGRVRMMLTGSAPISGPVKDFLHVAFCCPVLEGYGLTETVGLATISPVTARTLPGVGAPVACTELKLADIPEMSYFHTDLPFPRGEICLRGPNIFIGYYKAPALTAEAIDGDGWFHTGDVGKIAADGTVSSQSARGALWNGVLYPAVHANATQHSRLGRLQVHWRPSTEAQRACHDVNELCSLSLWLRFAVGHI